jgi:hypothetical protein
MPVASGPYRGSPGLADQDASPDSAVPSSAPALPEPRLRRLAGTVVGIIFDDALQADELGAFVQAISVTPCVARPSSRIPTRVRTSTPCR